MRVTAFIRDYVTEEMKKKFQPAIDAVMPEYIAKLNELRDECRAIAKRANDEAVALCKGSDMLIGDGHCLINVNSLYGIGNQKLSDERAKRINELLDKRDQMTRDILLRLEIGEANKNDLKGILDSVVVE